MRRSLGQHFLADAAVARRIVEAAGLAPGSRVVEIGPGRGALTGPLLEAGLVVTAVELDGGLAEGLSRRFAGHPRLELLHADFLKLEPGRLPARAACVANLPYAVAAPMLRRVLGLGWSPALLMFQKEVAERILAGPGSRKYGVLSLQAAARARARWVCEAPARCFSPPPRVDSAVLRFDLLEAPLVPPGPEEERFLALVQDAFRHRRKTLANSLALARGLRRADAEAWLRGAGLDPGLRAEQVPVQDFLALARVPSGP